MTRSEPALRLGVLATPGSLLSSLAEPGDMLRVAAKLAEVHAPATAPRFETVVFSADGADEVVTADGLRLSGLAPPPRKLDVLVIPGMMHNSPQDLADRVAVMHTEIALLRELHLRGTRLAGSCSGTFLLAATGLLDGRRATTSWWLAAKFRREFPHVHLDEAELLVDEGNVLTTGAAAALQNLMLRLITASGGEALAQQTARVLLVDPDRQSQAPYVSRALIERPRHSLSEKAERFLQTELHKEITVTLLAEHCGTTERSLLRHFRSHYGVSPLAHIQRMRVERAKALLESSRLSFEEIMERCGYQDVSSFRKLFKRATTMTPADYRERFRLRSH